MRVENTVLYKFFDVPRGGPLLLDLFPLFLPQICQSIFPLGEEQVELGAGLPPPPPLQGLLPPPQDCKLSPSPHLLLRPLHLPPEGQGLGQEAGGDALAVLGPGLPQELQPLVQVNSLPEATGGRLDDAPDLR